jgi:hypothetical protein
MKEYLVFWCFIKTTDLGDFESLVVVLTKIKKWWGELVAIVIIKSDCLI